MNSIVVVNRLHHGALISGMLSVWLVESGYVVAKSKGRHSTSGNGVPCRAMSHPITSSLRQASDWELRWIYDVDVVLCNALSRFYLLHQA